MLDRRTFFRTVIGGLAGAVIAPFVRVLPRRYVGIIRLSPEAARAMMASNATLFNPSSDIAAAYKSGKLGGTDWYADHA